MNQASDQANGHTNKWVKAKDSERRQKDAVQFLSDKLELQFPLWFRSRTEKKQCIKDGMILDPSTNRRGVDATMDISRRQADSWAVHGKLGRDFCARSRSRTKQCRHGWHDVWIEHWPGE
jgi:hypothetical protein